MDDERKRVLRSEFGKRSEGEIHELLTRLFSNVQINIVTLFGLHTSKSVAVFPQYDRSTVLAFSSSAVFKVNMYNP